MSKSSLASLSMFGLVPLSTCIALSSASLAQNTAEPLVEEIVVTAQKRAENVQDVPISMAVFSAESLEAAGVDDIRDLRNLTPGLFLATAPQVTNTRVAMRGIGTAGNTAIEPSVAFFLDGVYVPRVGSLLAGLNDIEMVEVLRGPQGTLFGRNASVGAVSLRTASPRNELATVVAAEAGEYGFWKGTGVFNAPLSDNFAVRLALLGQHTDGTGYEELNDMRLGENDIRSARLSARWEITPNVSWVLKADYQTVKGDGAQAVSVVTESLTPTAIENWRARLDPDGPGPLTGDLPLLHDTYDRHVRQDSGGTLDDEQFGLSSDLTWNFGADWSLRLISGYRDWSNDQFQNSIGNVPLPTQNRRGTYDSKSFSTELQLISPDTLLDGRANFVSGLYYYDETFLIGDVQSLLPAFCDVFIRNTQPARLAGCLAGQQENAIVLAFDQDTRAWAGFFQGTYRITPSWDVTAGIRYSRDEKEGTFSQQSFNPAAQRATEFTELQHDDDEVTYRLGTSLRVLDDVTLFATYTTGYKSGGFDSGGGTTVQGQSRIFRPEVSENYELGVKSLLFDRRMTLNAVFYWMIVDDLQFRTYDGVSFRVRNDGKIRQRGVEWDLAMRPTNALTFSLSAAYLDSEYLDFRNAPGLPGHGGVQDLTGERAPYSPEFQAAAMASYEIPLPWHGLTLQLRSDVSYVSEMSLAAAGDNNPDAMEPEHTIVGARLALLGADDRWELALIGKNLTDELVCGTRFAQPNDAAYGLRDPVTGKTVLRCTLSEPRVFSIALKARF